MRDTATWDSPHICTQIDRLPHDFFEKSPFGRSLMKKTKKKKEKVLSDLNIEHFRRLGFSQPFCDTLEFGLPLLMHAQPPKTRVKNHHTAIAKENREFVATTLEKWENMKVFRFVNSTPHVINPLKVAIKEDKKRLVLDARSSGLNEFLTAPKFALPDLEAVIDTLVHESFMIKADLASGFLQLPINKKEQTYLGFIHPINGRKCVLQRLLFGLASAPFLFQTFTQTIAAGVKEILNVQTKVYIDDWFLTRPDIETLQAEFESFQNMLEYLGVKLQHSKTKGPTRDIVYLGLGINSVTHRMYLPEQKREKYLANLTRVLEEEDDHKIEQLAKKNS